MKRTYHAIIVLWIGFILSSACTENQSVQNEQAYETIISAHTSGAISRESTIKIRFADDMADSARIDQSLDASIFSFEPSLNGTALWTDSRTLEFRPSVWLSAGQRYNARVTLEDLPGVPAGLSMFTFEFSTIAQSFDVRLDGLQAPDREDLRRQRLGGRVVTADVVEADALERIMTVTQDGQPLSLEWIHRSNRRNHDFVVNNITRQDAPSEVIVSWNGDPIGVEEEDRLRLVVPPLTAFSVASIKPVQGETDYIEIRFTDPIQQNQNLRGLIRAGNRRDLNFTVVDNVVQVFSSSRWAGDIEVTVSPGIRNSMGTNLETSEQASVSFAALKPQIRFVGKGTILPTTQGLTLPLEAVNLRGVMVEATRIYEKNIPQFLQVNNLDGQYEMERVGKVVWEETIDLGLTSDKVNRWMTYGLDISPLLPQDPGAIYRLKLTFQQRHIVYQCPEHPELADPEREDWSGDELENNTMGERDWSAMYRNRFDPCHPGYYEDYYDHNIEVKRNVLISDIGLMAKRGQSNEVVVAVTNLQEATPISGIDVSMMDFQQRIISTGRTNPDGMLRLDTGGQVPYLLVARRGGQSGYLRLDAATSQPIGHFDVSGQTVREGIKGYIYGERGVWRPGDPIFLTFVLFDTERRIPRQHPVIFEFRNARGQVVKTVRKSESVKGFYHVKLETEPDAPTGNWEVRVKVGGATFNKVLKVATVMPNRLKVDLDFGDGVDKLSGDAIRGTLSARWLHGAVARNLRSIVELSLKRSTTSFDDFDGFVFDDPATRYNAETRTIFEGNINQNGVASVSSGLWGQKSAPGKLQANFKTRVFESGGAFSVNYQSIPYYPFNRYVGVRPPEGTGRRGTLATGAIHAVPVVMVDLEGRLLTDARVELKLYKIGWRWWWERSGESLAQYINSRSYTPVVTDTLSLANGRGNWSFSVGEREWGRYLIRARDLDGDHASGTVIYMDYPYGRQRDGADLPGGATVLTFNADKEEYQVGETITLTMPSAQEGRTLISVENGTKVLWTDWVEGNGEDLEYTFEATEEMAPNVYAHVSLIQPHLQAVNDLPIRMYGIIPIGIVNPETRIEPRIQAPGVFTPETRATVRISENTGRPMAYTLAVVDEGLLDLTNFATPNPWDQFYQREALGVRTWDLFDRVAGAYGGTLEQLLAIGGDADADPGGGENQANRFPPMVRYLGPFELEEDETNTHTIDIPQYVGSVRMMVVAGYNGAFGASEETVPVRKPVMVLGTLPRVLGPEEEVDLPVSVFAMEDGIEDVTVNISTQGPLAIAGTDTRTATFSEPGDQLVTFDLKARPETGVASVAIEAVSGNERARQSIEIGIRHPSLPVHDVADTTLLAGNTWERRISLPGMTGTNRAVFEVSRTPPINLDRRLNYLIRYPHGCVEQVTSAVFAQLYLDDIMDLDDTKKAEIERNVKAGIQRLRAFQASGGGFAYWPGERDGHPWGSNYAGHFLLEARQKGYVIPSGMLEQWQRYQSREAQVWNARANRSDLIQAYRLYTLALSGASDLGAMNRLKEMPDLGAMARWRLAAAYLMAGQREAALELTSTNLTFTPYREMSNTFGSHNRDRAMALETLVLLEDLDRSRSLAEDLSDALSNDDWMSTQSTAYALIAMARHAQLSGTDNDMNLAVSWGLDERFASWLTLQAMLEVKRPGIEQTWRHFLSSQKVAWKTGTSQGFRDAWAIGVTPQYAVGVWVGNADGVGVAGLIGTQVAAPILFEVVDMLGGHTWFERPELDLTEIDVCLQSGYRAGPHCQTREKQWVPLKGREARACSFCRLIHCDQSMAYRVNGDCERISNIQPVKWFVLPPAMEWYYMRSHTDYRPLPPYRDDCRDTLDDETPSMSLIYPTEEGSIYVPLDLDGTRSRTVFQAAHRLPGTTIYWHLDEDYLGTTRDIHQMELAPNAGQHTLTLVDEFGENLTRRFTILEKE